VLEDACVSTFINDEAIESWIQSVLPLTELPVVAEQSRESPIKEQLLSMLKQGVKSCGLHDQEETVLGGIIAKIINDDDKDSLDRLTAILCGDNERGKLCDRKLAYLMMVRSRYNDPPPRLSLGTIVAEDVHGNTRYRCCILPRCDSAHLKHKRMFQFLKMTKRNAQDSFGYVIFDKDEFQLLNMSLRPYESEMIEFEPSQNEMVVAIKHEGEWLFQSGERKLRWVADLKPDHAQRVANDYAAQISRVGLTESEWQRRWAKKGLQ